jgi:peptidyl-prolyl cis-trans isomerase C
MKRYFILGSLVLLAFFLASVVLYPHVKAAQGDLEVPAVVATVNGQEISGKDYEKTLTLMKKQQRGSTTDPAVEDNLKQEALEQLIVIELLNQEADALHIQVEPKAVEQKIEQVEKSVGGKQAFDKALESNDLTQEEFKADVVESLRIQKLLSQEVFDSIEVKPQEIEEFYKANPEAFKAPEQVRARHIIIRVPKDATDEQRRQAKEKIQKAADRIAGGEDFAEVAKEVSQDGAAAKGGDLGFFSRGQMVPAFEKVAFSLEPGKVSDVVETDFGYHLIKVEEKRPEHTVALEEVRPKIQAYLMQKKQKEGVGDYVQALREKAQVVKSQF